MIYLKVSQLADLIEIHSDTRVILRALLGDLIVDGKKTRPSQSVPAYHLDTMTHLQIKLRLREVYPDEEIVEDEAIQIAGIDAMLDEIWGTSASEAALRLGWRLDAPLELLLRYVEVLEEGNECYWALRYFTARSLPAPEKLAAIMQFRFTDIKVQLYGLVKRPVV